MVGGYFLLSKKTSEFLLTPADTTAGIKHIEDNDILNELVKAFASNKLVIMANKSDYSNNDESGTVVANAPLTVYGDFDFDNNFYSFFGYTRVIHDNQLYDMLIAVDDSSLRQVVYVKVNMV